MSTVDHEANALLAPADPAPRLSGALSLPRGRDLRPAELVGLAAGIVRRPALWADRVEHREGERTFALLHDDEHLQVWLICWSPGSDTGFHDHDGSAAGVALAEGVVHDERLTLGGPPVLRRLGRGDAARVEPTEIHRVHHPGGAPAVSVHAYSPPLHRMGSYSVADDGRLLRHATDGHDELAPID